MIVVREVIYCKPGKVRPLVEKFLAMSKLMEKSGMGKFKVMTDISAERYWTVVAESGDEGPALDGGHVRGPGSERRRDEGDGDADEGLPRAGRPREAGDLQARRLTARAGGRLVRSARGLSRLVTASSVAPIPGTLPACPIRDQARHLGGAGIERPDHPRVLFRTARSRLSSTAIRSDGARLTTSCTSPAAMTPYHVRSSPGTSRSIPLGARVPTPRSATPRPPR